MHTTHITTRRPQLIKVIFAYTCIVVVAKFMFQLPIFCQTVFVNSDGEVPPDSGKVKLYVTNRMTSWSTDRPC